VPKVVFHKQGGLLDVAVDPDFARNQLVYLSYSEAADQQPAGAKEERDERLGPGQDLKDNVLKGAAVARGRLDGSDLRDVTVIWRQVPKTIGRGHFGGRLVFARDGTLFITSGDRHAQAHPRCHRDARRRHFVAERRCERRIAAAVAAERDDRRTAIAGLRILVRAFQPQGAVERQ
jgi:glucose/arabinose dehydrogenase